MPKATKITVWALAIVAGLTAFAAVAVPRIVNIDRYRPQAISQIENATGKRATIGRLTLRILPSVAIRVENFSLANPDGFPQGNCVQAKQFDAVLDVIQLLHHHVAVTALKFDGFTLALLEDTHGTWNFENHSDAPSPPASPSEGQPIQTETLGAISTISVADGNFSVANLLPSGDRGPSLMDIRGVKAGLQDVHLDAISAHSVPAPGVSLAQGTIQAAAVVFGPINVSGLQSKIRIEPRKIDFQDMNLKSYGGEASGNLSLTFGDANLTYDTDAILRGVKVEQFLDTFPQTRGLLTGTMQGAATIRGVLLKSNDPLEGAHGSGHATIRDGQMPSLQIAGNLRSLVQLANLGPGNGDSSSFSSLSADFQIADGRLASEKIDLEGNGMSVAGSGSLTAAGEGSLDYHAEASLDGAGSNPLTAVLGSLAGGKIADGKLTVPFTVTGTFAKPRFSLQSGAVNNQAASSPNAAKNQQLLRGLGAFFKKKKQD